MSAKNILFSLVKLEESGAQIWTFVTNLFQKLLFRPSPKPSKAVCIGTRSVGHYRIKPGWQDLLFPKTFTQFFWSVAGTGFIRTGGRKFLLPPGSVGLYFPNEKHEVGTEDPACWEYRWWTMDGPMAESIVRALGFGDDRIYQAGPAPVGLFEELKHEISDVSYGGEVRADAVAFRLLSAIAAVARPNEAAPVGGPRPFRSFRNMAIECIQKSWQDLGFGVSQMADSLGLHRSVLSRRFQLEFGMPPSEYILRWRVQNALRMLTENDLPVHQVARACGWEDPNYFSRCVRKVAGYTPRMARRAVLGHRE